MDPLLDSTNMRKALVIRILVEYCARYVGTGLTLVSVQICFIQRHWKSMASLWHQMRRKMRPASNSCKHLQCNTGKLNCV